MAVNDPSREPVIVAAARTAVGKAKRGSLATTRPDVMSVAVIRELLKRVPALNPAEIDDVVLGCAFPEGEQGMNMARLVALAAGLPNSVPAETINRFCSSGLQSIAHAAFAIMAGQAQVILAGGAESMSMVPMTGFKFAPMPVLAEDMPQAFTAMGLTAENVAVQYGVSRVDQDQFALESNLKASRAVEAGTFDPEIVPLEISIVEPGENGHKQTRTFVFKRDEGPRADTSLEALAKLKPAFKEGGTVTAGNSSQMSDGAAGAVVMSQARAEALGLKPLVRFVAYAVGGVPPEIMGIGPIVAVPKALKLAGLALSDIGLIELNEAFAAQGLAVMRELGLNPEITNVNGGAIALGHPLGCTGAKLTTQLIYEMKRRKVQFGMVTMCIGGGMGAAGIFENLDDD
ncbi:MAG: acetyl-CoA acetyltransferase [Anaerolineae bacterium UTCFX2]|nr:acetyl-CoA C-acyltransferase [Anaerolineae bacterium]MCZ7551610.1 acetyl-CoA C-acyltransferase [Anaerolineales bacterium]OQY88138.1 MAG: acetyl-CoA acetyltransferase [Anaerolineae bacterium UTCFX2]